MPLIMPFQMPFYHATLKFTIATQRVLAPVLIHPACNIGFILFTMPPTMPFILSFLLCLFIMPPEVHYIHPASTRRLGQSEFLHEILA